MKRLLTIAFLFLSIITYAQFAADFEAGTIHEWTEFPAGRWSASTDDALAGSYSLKHTFNNTAAATDIIYRPLDSLPVNSGITQWRFLVRHGYNPSSSNKWAAFLFSNQPGTEWKSGGTYEGYALGVNMVGSDDTLTLYAVRNNRFSIITKTTVNWQEDIQTTGTPAIAVTRTADGEWTIKLAPGGDFGALQIVAPVVTHTAYGHAGYFGLRYTYSSTADTLLWIDNVSVDFTRVVVPTKIRQATLTTQKSITVLFSQKVEQTTAERAGNYQLLCADMPITPTQATLLSENQVLLQFEHALPQGAARLTVADIIDENNRPVNDTFSFSMFYRLYGDIVINEIMAAPAPSVELPEVAYIELYNRSDTDILMEGWKMEYNTTTGNIGAATIPANGYLILCTSSALEVMREYGNAINVSYISSLTKSGKTLSLKDNEGTLISRVAYSNKWITDENKQAGGWSLEKIDPGNLSETPANWRVSVDTKGGTPGQANSLLAKNPDKEAPFISRLEYVDAQTLRLTCSELFDNSGATNRRCYTVNNGIGNPKEVLINSEAPEQVLLVFSKSFQEGVLYELTVSAPFRDLAGNAPELESYTFGNLFLPAANEIIINEVLFNPHPNGVDFVEIYNRSDKIFDLQQLKIANRDKNNTIASVQDITPQYYLHPGHYALLTTDLEAVTPFYSVPFPDKAIVLNTLPSYPNESGCVLLLSADDTVVDEFLYSEKMHSGFIANAKGISLERVNPDRPAGEQANWQSAAQGVGFATPTYRNSQHNINSSVAAEAFSLPYEVFSPDGDGYNDVLYIDYALNTSGYVATITVYDSQGRPVKEVEKKTLLGTSGRFAWDGTRYDQQKARPGMYIIFVEYFDLNGDVQRIKKSCALAMRR